MPGRYEGNARIATLTLACGNGHESPSAGPHNLRTRRRYWFILRTKIVHQGTDDI
jgi:hypothetical protein